MPLLELTIESKSKLQHLLGIGGSTISVRDRPEYMFKKCIVQIMSLLLYISYSVLQMVYPAL